MRFESSWRHQIELLLIRYYQLKNKYAFGSLYINDQWECYTLEDPVREVTGQSVSSWKIKGLTAIPRGRYQVVINYSERFQRLLPLLLDVPGFTGIRIHPGNKVVDTEGCILTGRKIVLEEEFLQESQVAFDALFEKLLEAVMKEKVWITIV